MPQYLGSTALLPANGVFTSTTILTDICPYITGTVFADQVGTLYIEQSGDGITWDSSTSYAIPAGQGKGFKEDVVGSYLRIRYVNGAVPQGAFRLIPRLLARQN